MRKRTTARHFVKRMAGGGMMWILIDFWINIWKYKKEFVSLQSQNVVRGRDKTCFRSIFSSWTVLTVILGHNLTRVIFRKNEMF